MGRVRRRILMVVAMLVIAALLQVVPAAAQAPESPAPEPTAEQDAPPEDPRDEEDFDWTLPGPDPIDVPPPAEPPTHPPFANPETDKPGVKTGKETIEIPLEGGVVAFPTLPLAIDVAPEWAEQGLTVEAKFHNKAKLEKVSDLGYAFRLTFRDAKNKKVDPAFSAILDYADVPVPFGGDALERLTVTVGAGCDETADVVCSARERLEPAKGDKVQNNPKDRKLRVEFAAGEMTDRADAAVRRQRQQAAETGTANPAGFGTTSASFANSGEAVLALALAGSGGAGDYAATPLAPVADYQVGVFGGGAETSYPIPLPEAPSGVTPSVVLGYSSSSVDFMTPLRNNQPGWVGLGWSYEPGSITRVMKAGCDPVAEKDHCIIGDHYTLSLNGVSSELVKEPGTSNQFRLKDDPYWKIQRKFNAASNHPDQKKEYWLVTTPDGIDYRFGGEFEPNTGADMNSAFYTTVWSPSSGEASVGCSGSPQYGLCDRVYKWNLDVIEDPDGNRVSFFYSPEYNHYDARGFVRRKYTRGGNVSQILYTKRNGANAAHVQVKFVTADRCESNCGNTANWADTPLDLQCTASGSCDDDRATYWSKRRLDEIQVRARANTTDPWTIVSRYRLDHTYPKPPMDARDANGGTNASATKMWLYSIQQRKPDDSGGLRKITYSEVFKNNRLNDPGNNNLLAMARLQTITTELRGKVTFVYGQSHPCPTGTQINFADHHKDCFPAPFDPDPDDDTAGADIAFNKWKVTKMTLKGQYGGSDTETYDYVYSAPSWALTDNPVSPIEYHSDFRGHPKVRVKDAKGETVHYFYQGMHKDPGQGGTPKTATVKNSVGASFTDHNYLRGRPLEVARVSGTTTWTRTEHRYSAKTTTSMTDSDGRSAPRFVAPSKLFEWVGGSKSTTTFAYDAYGNQRKVEFAGLVGGADNYTVLREFLHATGPYIVDRPKRERTFEGTGTLGALVARTHYRYDGGAYGTLPTKGHVTKTEVDESASNVKWAVSEFGYDSRGRQQRAVDPLGAVTCTYYNQAGRVREVRAYISKVRAFCSDTSASLKTKFEYDAAGRQTKITDETGGLTHLEYDTYGRLSKVWLPTEPSSGAATMRYDYFPSAAVPYVRTRQLLKNSNYLNSYSYVDGFGREIQTQVPFVTPGGTTKRTVVSRKYNNHGALLYESAPYELSGTADSGHQAPNWSTVNSYHWYTYTGHLQPNEDRLRTKNTTRWRVKTAYSQRTVVTTDANNHKVERDLDANGNITEVREYTGTGPYNLYSTTAYTYDPVGRLEKVVDGKGNQTRMFYDLLGRKTKMIDPDMGTWEYGYDSGGNLTWQEDAKNERIYFHYDLLGRLEVRGTNPAPDSGKRAEYRYSSNGRLAWSKAYTPEGTVKVTYNTYDARSRVTKATTTVPGSGGGTFVEKWGYDAAGNLRTHQVPANASGGLGETITWNFDTTTGLPTTVKGGGTWVAYQTYYNAAGQVVDQRLGASGAAANRSVLYDSVTLRADRIRAGKGTPAVSKTNLTNLVYAFDPVGNVDSVVDRRNSWQKQCFTYDAMDRLKRAFTGKDDCSGVNSTRGDDPFNVTVSVDAVGNIETMKDPIGGVDRTYDYLDAGTPHGVTRVTDPSNPNVTVTYDVNGNIKTRNRTGDNKSFVFDRDHRLERVTRNGSTAAKYLYDADGNRVKATLDGVPTVFIGSAFEWTQGQRKIYYHQGGQLVGMKDGGTLWLALSDHLGSLSVMYAPSSGAEKRQRYLPFGEIRGGSSPPTSVGYTGQRLDEATGLMFYRARYYDPVLGRFISPDTIIPDASNPQDFNRYAYVRNNPVKYTDPTGHCPWFMKNSGGGCLGGSLVPDVASDAVAGGVRVVKDTAQVWEWGPDAAGTAVDFSSAVLTGDTERLKGYGGAAVDTVKETVRKAVSGNADERGQIVGELALGGLLRKLVKLRSKPDGSPPPIKPGTTEGPTSGKPFSQDVKDAAVAENLATTGADIPTCVWCRMETPDTHIDHAKPLSHGGNATLDNAQVSCPHCNMSRGNRDAPVTPPTGYEGPWPPPWWPGPR